MPRSKLGKQKGRRPGPPFVRLDKYILQSQEWRRLTAYEVKLFVDLSEQYNGNNNGDLSIAWSAMKSKGWRSSATLHKAMSGLIAKGWVSCTRRGGMHACSLYALTTFGIDECGGKHDEKPNPVPSHLWKNKFPIRVVNESVREVNECAA